MNEWWRGLAPAQATVDCGGKSHRLRWEGGAIRALDHGDVESERTLAALAAESCTCLDLIEAWDRHRDDIRVLVLASRGPTDIVAVHEHPGAQLGLVRPQAVSGGGAVGRGSPRSRTRRVQMFSATGAGSSGRTAYARLVGMPRPIGRTSAKAQAQSELVALLGLGGGLPDRLMAAVAAAWKNRLAQTDRPPARSRAQLQAALHGRVLSVMRSWLGASGSEFRLRMIGERGKPKLTSDDNYIRAELPFGWLVDVWAQGLTTIWGRFCLSASTDDGRTWKLTTVGPDLGRPAIVTLQLGG